MNCRCYAKSFTEMCLRFSSMRHVVFVHHSAHDNRKAATRLVQLTFELSDYRWDYERECINSLFQQKNDFSCDAERLKLDDWQISDIPEFTKLFKKLNRYLQFNFSLYFSYNYTIKYIVVTVFSVRVVYLLFFVMDR